MSTCSRLQGAISTASLTCRKAGDMQTGREELFCIKRLLPGQKFFDSAAAEEEKMN